MRVKRRDGKCESVWRGTQNLCDGFFKRKKNASDLEIRMSCAGPEEQSCQVNGNRKSIEVAGTGHT